jgi:hypothetical protein
MAVLFVPRHHAVDCDSKRNRNRNVERGARCAMRIPERTSICSMQ